MSTTLDSLPDLGVGLGYRSEVREQIFTNRPQIDFLELISDHYVDASPLRKRELIEVSATFPVVLHGVGMSVGTAEPVDETMLHKHAQLARESKALWFSEHLSFTKAHGIDLGHLTPLPFSEHSIEVVCHNVQLFKQHIPVPFLLENITYLFPIPGAEMSEAEFIARVVRRSDCGLLLDLTNVYTNATNHGYDPYDFLRQLPLDRVVQVHLAGGHWMDDVPIDSHSAPVPQPVWQLLEFLVESVSIRGILIERDEHMPPFTDLIDELAKARNLLGPAMDKTRGPQRYSRA